MSHGVEHNAFFHVGSVAAISDFEPAGAEYLESLRKSQRTSLTLDAPTRDSMLDLLAVSLPRDLADVLSPSYLSTDTAPKERGRFFNRGS